jgi:deoxyribonuclease-2
MDQSTSGQWVRSDKTIQSEDQSVGYTLKQFYANKRNVSVFSMLYNDEWPQGNVSFTKGHTKGEPIFIWAFWVFLLAVLKNCKIGYCLSEINKAGQHLFVGALVFDSSSGYWLIHSVPKFPPQDSYAYPATGAKYGQTLFCTSFPYSMLSEIGNNF